MVSRGVSGYSTMIFGICGSDVKHNPNHIIFALRLYLRIVSWGVVMIWQPKVGQEVWLNYKDKTMPCQGLEGEVAAISNGPGPRNVLIIIVDIDNLLWFHEVIPRGNLNAKNS
jgi:hypothetical protein